MSEVNLNNKRIAKNTFYLYIRMILLMVINLYTSRIILNSLGIEDFGIYTAVGGFVSMFTMISATLSTAISRYITYFIGLGEKEKLNNVFSTSVVVQIILCIVLVALFESVGLWFLNEKMTIPESRLVAANWVFQFSIITFLFNLLSVPYNAVLIAHERMSAFAYIGIFEGLATLCVAFLLKISSVDRLVLYSALMCAVSLIVRLIYGTYCKKKFAETRGRLMFDKTLVSEIFRFAGWNFIGVSSGVLRSQGLNLLLNVYYGPIVNAARGIAMQVFNAVNKFSGNFYTAVQPQITKSYAAKNYLHSNYLVCNSSRLSFFLLLLICLPLVVETEFILDFWLETYPNHTISLVRIILFFCMMDSFSQPMIYLMLATGDIKVYQIVVGGLAILNFPVAWLLLWLGASPELAQSTTILFSFITMIVRVVMLKRLTRFPVEYFWVNTFARSLFVVVLSFIVPILVINIMPVGIGRFLVNLILTELIAVIIIVFIGMRPSEREMIFSKLSILINKIR